MYFVSGTIPGLWNRTTNMAVSVFRLLNAFFYVPFHIWEVLNGSFDKLFILTKRELVPLAGHYCILPSPICSCRFQTQEGVTYCLLCLLSIIVIVPNASGGLTICHSIKHMTWFISFNEVCNANEDNMWGVTSLHRGGNAGTALTLGPTHPSEHKTTHLTMTLLWLYCYCVTCHCHLKPVSLLWHDQKRRMCLQWLSH